MRRALTITKIWRSTMTAASQRRAIRESPPERVRLEGLWISYQQQDEKDETGGERGSECNDIRT